jgi:hypothetical protein
MALRSLRLQQIRSGATGALLAPISVLALEMKKIASRRRWRRLSCWTAPWRGLLRLALDSALLQHVSPTLATSGAGVAYGKLY